MGQILLTGEKPDVCPPLMSCVVADSTAQHRIARLQRVEHRADGDLALDFELHLTRDARQSPEMCRKYDSDHGRVWTSTESTAGRSRTMGFHVSPASGDAYTWPPV